MKLLQKLKNNKHGFSLVELIVVIAIMAVIAVVPIPSLLRNVEESRAEKDVKSTDELVSAVELSLSDQDVYDELVEHSVLDNIACYIDKDSESEYTDNKTILKDGDIPQYTFNNDTRRLDESLYFGAGNMRGLTITFSPVKSSNETEYILKNGIINKFVARNIGYLGENQNLYNNIRQIIGDKLKLSSQTYRNSDFTVFIRMGTVGGNQASAQDAVQVWGQFNGTNLSSDTINTYKLTSDRTVGEAGLNDMKINIDNQDEKVAFNIQCDLPVTYNENTKKYNIQCIVTNSNLFDLKSQNVTAVKNKHFNLIDENDSVTFEYINQRDAAVSLNFDLKPNTEYTISYNLSFENDKSVDGNAQSVVITDNETNWFQANNALIAKKFNSGYNTISFKTKQSTENLKIYLIGWSFVNNTTGKTTVTNFQIEYGNQATEYKPHISQRITLTSPVEITENDRIIKRSGLYGWNIIDAETGTEKAFYPLPDNEQKILYDFEKSISQ